jgi:hypothetical protein
LPTLSSKKEYLAQSKTLFAVHDTIQARIIFIDHANKSIRMSLKSHILKMKKLENLPELGFFYLLLFIIIIIFNDYFFFFFK